MDVTNRRKTFEEIKNDFRASIEIPKNTPKKQFFFCPVGLVGAGKTTVTRPISKRLGLVRLSSDELRKILKENSYDYGSVKDIGFEMAQDFAKEGYSIAFDMDCGSPKAKESIEKLADETGAKIIWAHLNTPEEYILEKFKKHEPSWLADNPQVMIDNYFVQKERREKENTQFSYDFTFDTSRPDLDKQIDDCIEKIKILVGK
ncbi:MAG: AAA family ATPase [Candidatus Paceibacterota bacterium]|jgi:predicted kinase